MSFAPLAFKLFYAARHQLLSRTGAQEFKRGWWWLLLAVAEMAPFLSERPGVSDTLDEKLSS